MKDFKYRGLGSSIEVIQQRRKARVVSNALGAVGALIGALALCLTIIVMFEGSL